MNMPEPCHRCPVMRKHDCKMQPICTRVKAFYKREVFRRLEAQSIESHAKASKRMSRKYKGGAM